MALDDYDIEEYEDKPRPSADLEKGQGSSDHTSFPSLTYQESLAMNTMPYKPNYHPNTSPVFFEDKALEKQTSIRIMLVEDVH